MDVLTPVLAYSVCSMTMIFTNKLVLSSYSFEYPSVVLLFQGSIACLVMKVLEAAGIIKLEPINWATTKKWLPVTFFFGLMLYTGSQTLVFLAIPIVTVFKNLTNLVIAYGDWYFFNQTVTTGVLLSFFMMVVGSILTGFTDLEFSLVGYIWMALNCLSQAGYVLYAKHAKTSTQLSEWGMSYYNNALCVVLMCISSVLTGELHASLQSPAIYEMGFLVSLFLSGIVGTGLSFTVFWVISATSPTTYSMVGSLNKIPITILSVLIFKTHMSWKMIVSITFGLLSGIVYTRAKIKAKVKDHGSVAVIASDNQPQQQQQQEIDILQSENKV
eukprot:m.139779 g.139779  ORF g.139779 m.139779 type:complete len:329 (+) comp24544_c0_seq1:176-1162(+)